ncbi:MAG: glycosyltransferase [Gaiella sp.]
MPLRICLVTPFSWSQPHDTNEHVGGAAGALRERGHQVTVIAPSSSRRALAAGRRAIATGEAPEVLAVGPAVPVSRRSQLGVAARAATREALRYGRFDIVHGFEPTLPSLAQFALLDAETLTVTTFESAERAAYPATKAQRDRLLARVDQLLTTSEQTAEIVELRYPGSYRVVPLGVDGGRFVPGPKRKLIVAQVESAARAIPRSAIRALDELPEWELILLHTAPLTWRPAIPPRLRPRVHVRSGRRPEARVALLAKASIFCPAPGHERTRLEAQASGCAIASPHAAEEQPELVTAAVARLAENDRHRTLEAGRSRAEAERQSFERLAEELEDVYMSLIAKRRPAFTHRNGAAPEHILVDLHMHTRWSHDCSIEVEELLDHAQAIGLGAIAITDHNVFGGALEATALAAGRELVVIPGEEVKTDGQGEVIGLFLEREIPRGMTFAETIAAIREQNGIVYLPHPFDRMHAIPDPATLHRHLSDIDVFEVYNARLLRESFNHEALRFARKFRLLQGAGSDAHVLQGVGTGALRLPRFESRDEFLAALRDAEVVRRPKSLAYLQSLKWVAQMREGLASR